MLCGMLVLLANCAAPDTNEKGAKLSDMFATPEWAKFSNSKPSAQRRAITPDDLVSADGRCAAPVEAAPVQTAEAPTDAASDASAAQPGAPLVAGGIALAMTECEVVHRTGAPSSVDIGAEGTTRIATVTVTQGANAGLYRFRAGRLISIERIDVPAPARPTRATKAKKSAPPAMRGSQQ